MNTQEIKTAIANINRYKWEIESELEENGGELTPELLEKYDLLEDLKAVLSTEGVDDLGRWLLSVQADLAARKAEAEAAARKVKNLKGYEDYVKGLIEQALEATGQEQVKGQYYGFKRRVSTTSSVLQNDLEAKYLELAQVGARMNGLPDFVEVKIKTTTTDLRNAGGDALAFLWEETAPALTFTKPRAKKED